MINPIDYLYFHARFNADAMATQRLGGGHTQVQLLALVRGIAFKLRRIGVRPGQVVVTCLKNPHTDWTLTLALMHEAAATCSNHGYTPLPKELPADLVITERTLPGFPVERQLVLDEAWLKDLPAVPGDFGPQAYASENSPFRLVLTSGTTGQSKIVAMSLDMLIKSCVYNHKPTAQLSKTFCFMALSTGLGIQMALVHYMKGAPFYHASSYAEVIQLIETCQIEGLVGSPIQLSGLIEELQRTTRRFTSLKSIYYGGGEAAPSLLNAMRRDLCPHVVCGYGSTEAGGVSRFQVHDPSLHPGMVGYVIPEAQVQIVNPADEVLPPGEEGLIRIRTIYMVHEYYNNPEETRRFFRDGWFYPGDRGKFLANGALILVGREGERINRGGIKIDPADIDRCVQDHPGVKDAAAFSFENLAGVEDVCVAIVVDDGFDIGGLQKHVFQTLGLDRNPSVFLRLAGIPRNQMGKALRKEMRERLGEGVRQMLRQRDSAAGPGQG